MEICDMCFRRSGESRAAPIKVTVGVEKAELCNSCAEELRGLIWNPPKEQEKQERPKRHKQ